MIKALAHPSRLLIVDALAEGERCVCELQRLVGSDISTVSKHLALMRAAGLVLDRREGQQVFYRLRVPCILQFFDCVDAVVSAPGAGKAEVAGDRCAPACRPCRAAAQPRGARGST